MSMVLTIYLTVKSQSSKTIGWIASTCASVVEVFNYLTRGHFLWCLYPIFILQSPFSQLHWKKNPHVWSGPSLHGFHFVTFFAHELWVLGSLFCSSFDGAYPSVFSIWCVPLRPDVALPTTSRLSPSDLELELELELSGFCLDWII